jgi:hypothetical protein
MQLDFMCHESHFKKREESVSISVDVTNYNPSAAYKILVLTEPALQDLTWGPPGTSQEYMDAYGAIMKSHSEGPQNRHRVGYHYPQDLDGAYPGLSYLHDIPFGEFVIKNANHYDLILTYDQKILDTCENAKFFLADWYMSMLTPPIGGPSWEITQMYHIYWMKKRNQISMLTGDAQGGKGHAVRQEIYEHMTKKYGAESKIGKYEFLNIKTGWNEVETEEESTHAVWPSGKEGKGEKIWATDFPCIEGTNQMFMNAKFAIIIENTFQTNKISERMLDCFLTKTVPIYYGAPNVGDLYNTDGIVPFDSIESLEYTLNKIGTEFDLDWYDKLGSHIEENYGKALAYSGSLENNKSFYSAIDEEIDTLIKFNGEEK